ncbi:MAG: DUF2332 family protein [Phenylobacterium sp.]|nr:MAG: DUF2332 family protein [Phenylobacterium sp.]
MDETPDILKGLRLQGGVCRQMGSPLTAAILERAADDAGAGGPVAGLLEPWAEAGLKQVFEDAAPLRLAAAFHELALSGEAPALSAAYAALDAERIWPQVLAAIPAHRARLVRFMRHEPQTNEVRRSICLLGGFLEIAKATGLPLRCFELAASAGLNLSWDRYRYEIAGDAWGDPAATVRMDTDWTGPPPPLDAAIEVVERAACDRRPTDLADPEQRRRLLAYYWPDQTERIARIHAAIDLALATGVHVDEADAVDWLKAKVAPRAGAATVVYHSVFWTYMPPPTQAALTAAIEALGARATAQAPVAWLSMEPKADDIATMEVRLRLWPDGEDRLLAETQAHGGWVRWRG